MAEDFRITSGVKSIFNFKIPSKFRIVTSSLYRVMALTSINDYKEDEYQSFTMSKSVVKDLANSPHMSWAENGNNKKIFLFYIKSPNPSNCFLNLSKLLRDREFLNSIDYWESLGNEFYGGLAQLDAEREIIYKAEKNEFDSIYELQKNEKWRKIK